jgi:phosphohistidine swiveling domain-containing protein
MKFITKGQTLVKLKKFGFNVPKLILIKQEIFHKNCNLYLKKISKNFKHKISIRSSAIDEDTSGNSLAGKYQSFLNINPQNKFLVKKKIEEVIKSYKRKKNNEVIIQEMVKDNYLSGVCTTVDLHNYLPVININYDKNSRTDTVTSGSINSKTLTILEEKYHNIKNKKIKNLIKEIKKLKHYFKSQLLDVEFSINKIGKVYILQSRKIILPKNMKIFSLKIYKEVLKKIEKKILKLQEKNYDLYGNTNCFGVMPDWNPAEIIGIKPRPLALSLYKELITDHIWAKNRLEYGFRNLESHHLMTTFYGTPYVDVRVDFNSWIPKDLDEKLSKKLVNFYLKKFKKNKNLHDKIEFKILFTCFTANTLSRLKNELSKNFSKNEINLIKNSLIKINKIAYNSSFNDIKKINKLKIKQEILDRSKIYPLNKIYFLIEDCKKFGTLPFAGLARCGFIAIDILNSFVDAQIMNLEEKDTFLNSIKNIAFIISEDFNKFSKEKFCKTYGHLRPSTYDITSLNYMEGYTKYFNKKIKEKKQKKIFLFRKEQISKINKFLISNNFKIKANQLEKFIRDSIYNREYSKFIFVKSIDLIFKNLIIFGRKFKIRREDLSFIDISSILGYHYALNHSSITNQIKMEIQRNKKTYNFNSRIHLPETICTKNDLYYSYKHLNNGNFITQKIINEKIIYYKNIKDVNKINNKIILIDSADPGYDFIFTKKIKGLITKFGGQNSHMSIRAAELALPACIGIGEEKFNEIYNKTNLTLDCLNKKVF